MDELIRLWLRPEYLPMLAIIALTVKLVVVPVVKALWYGSQTHPNGYTPVAIAVVSSIAISFLYKWLKDIGAWDAEGIIMTILVGLMAAFTAIGANVTTQVLRRSDVSIKQ